MTAWVDRYGLPFALVAGGLLRFAALGGAPSSLDETWSFAFANSVVLEGDFFGKLRTGLDAPLASVVNVGVARLLGPSMFTLRLPMAIAGFLTLPLVYDLIRRWQTHSLAAWSVVFCALNPFLVYYSRTARPYALMLLACVFFLWSFERLRARRRLVVAGLAMPIAVASHYYALVFFAAFFAVVFWQDPRVREGDRLHFHVRLALFGLVLCTPMLVGIGLRLGTLSVPYWTLSDITLPSLIVEQWLFLGTALGAGNAARSLLALLLALVLLVPFVMNPRRHELHPFLRHGWWAPYAVVVVGGAVLGTDLLFYARGFIATAPVAFVGWLHGVRQLPRWMATTYRSLILVAMTLGSVAIATNAPSHPYLRGRDELRRMVDRVESYRARYDFVLVHHWWMAMVFERYAEDPKTFVPLNVTKVAVNPGFAWAGALAALERVPPDARVALVLNDLATRHSDPGMRVVRALQERRDRLGEVPCADRPNLGTGLVCREVLFFGAERDRP